MSLIVLFLGKLFGLCNQVIDWLISFPSHFNLSVLIYGWSTGLLISSNCISDNQPTLIILSWSQSLCYPSNNPFSFQKAFNLFIYPLSPDWCGSIMSFYRYCLMLTTLLDSSLMTTRPSLKTPVSFTQLFDTLY